MKYETVIGIIGKTHGVKSEIAPKVTASQRNDQRSVCWLFVVRSSLFVVWLETGDWEPAAVFFTSSSPLNETRFVRGGRQKVSLHSWKRTSRASSSMLAPFVSTAISNDALFSK